MKKTEHCNLKRASTMMKESPDVKERVSQCKRRAIPQHKKYSTMMQQETLTTMQKRVHYCSMWNLRGLKG